MQDPDFLQDRLDDLRDTGQYRELPPDRSGVDFWSNDYLGFSRLLPPIHSTAAIAPGSRLISGNHSSITDLEDRIARWHGFPAALLFPSGYTANLGLLSCIARRTDTIIYDELIHASLRDGIRLSGATARRCKHNDLGHAEQLLEKSARPGRTFFVTESRFSMDGDTAPIPALVQITERAGALLIVDEAHATGLDGHLGAGLVAAHRLQQRVFAVIATYGKAPGYHGGCVLGSSTLRDYLINFSRPFIFSTGPRPEQIAGLAQVYTLLKEKHAQAYRALQAVISTYREAAVAILSEENQVQEGPIQLVRIGNNQGVMEAERRMLEAGFLVKAIRSPSVPVGTERLRICLHAFNTEAEVRELVTTICAITKQSA